ncbi:MAG: NAD(P)/FAD-dependent oxidoreductase [Acidobacteria bacterium]|nr:NAD(P)/FAD-dependent oxidoreductase [Acidobacteriota bacterium]
MARVVIVGGGFGGLLAAKALAGKRDVEVTLIDRRNFHVFQPLLYQVATGGLSPADICAPLRSVLRDAKNIRTVLAEVTGFDLEGRRVLLADGEFGYDYLIVAAGARHHYFGNDSWEEHAPGLKSIEDATEIRRRILTAFEAAERESDPAARRALLTFLIVGGGPTGVELSGTLGEIANDTLRADFRSFRPEEARILLLERGPRILSAFPDPLPRAAEESLLKLGVRVRTGAVVETLDAGGVTVKIGGASERIEAKTVLWAAGVKASPIGELLGVETDRAGRVIVRETCQLPGRDEVFVIGDMAAFPAGEGKTLPGVAPVAIQQGGYVAAAILKQGPLAPFRYVNKGNMATIGRAAAIADFGSFQLTGLVAWLFWLFVHILFLIGFRNRLMVMLHWAFQYFTFNRGARLIAAQGAAPPSANLRDQSNGE